MRTIMRGARVPLYKIAKRVEFIDEENSTPSSFYVMPKIHKKKLFASRPVQARHSHMLTPLSRELTNVLQEIVGNIPVISKDSKATSQELNECAFTKPGVVLTYDVEAMYPSIDLEDSISILQRNAQALNDNGSFCLEILEHILFNNYVSFNGKIFRQMQGTASGTCMAPPFANL